MPKKRNNGSERQRKVLAQEAARIIVNHGVRDYRVAKQKAAERLGTAGRGSLPGNAEIETAVAEHLALFGGEAHEDRLRLMRVAALSAMDLLATFSPRLVGPVLAGTADENSVVNLHVFADHPEAVALELEQIGIGFRTYERRLKSRRNRVECYSGFEFNHGNNAIQAKVFPGDGIRPAPMSPIDGKPMKRADSAVVQALVSHS